jgi:aarF domain-containing kinase
MRTNACSPQMLNIPHTPHTTHTNSRSLQHPTVSLAAPITGATRRSLPLAPTVTEEDRRVVDNVATLIAFLTNGRVGSSAGGSSLVDPSLLSELLPLLPTVALEIMPQLTQRLVSRITARFVREVYLLPPPKM